MTSRQQRLPLRVVDRIEEAGASVYEWYEQELRAYLDPSGRLTSVSTLLSRAWWVVVALAFVNAHSLNGPILVVAVLLVCLASLSLSRLSGFGSVATAALTVLALAPHGADRHLVAGIAGFAAIHLLWPSSLRRGAQTGWALGLSLALVGTPNDTRQWVALGVAFVFALGASWVANEFRPLSLGGRVTSRTYGITPPAPATGLPWLLRMWPLTGRVIRQIERGSTDGMPETLRSIARKRIGGSAERQTAVLLLALKRGRGALIAHDVDLPGADAANIDHLVVTPRHRYAIDTKRYGTVNDPGRVSVRNGEVVHATSQATRSLEGSLTTLAWACNAAAPLLGGGVVRGVMVIHNADVEPGIVVERDGAQIAVICAAKVLSLIEVGQRKLKPRELWGSGARRWDMRKFRSSTTHGAPRVVSPLGLRHAPRSAWTPPLDTAPVAGAPSLAQAHQGSEEGQERPLHAASDLRVDPSSLEPDMAARTQMRVERSWGDMASSEPAAPDDVSPELRGIARGTAITVVDFSDGDMKWRSLTAMSGPCQGADGPFVWACLPEQHRLHASDGRPVTVVTVPLAKVMIETRENS